MQHQDFDRSYDYYIVFDENPANRKMSVWCFSASFTMRKLLRSKPRSVIIASGTLSPLPQLEVDFQTRFLNRVSADHCIDKKEQLLLATLSHSPDNHQLAFTHANVKSLLPDL